MCRKCYITTPIYYASGTPQLGNSYSTVACDVFARFNRAMGRETFYLTGMDEHGQKIEEAAAKKGKDPQGFTDEIADKTKAIWNALHISYDKFIRTTDSYHVENVQKIFEKLLANNDIYLGSYTGNYCVSCETFFTKTQLGENDTCPDCGKPTKLVAEESYFLNLKKYAPRLLEYIKTHEDFITPETRKNEVVSFIESGLEDLCVSRTSFKWGIPVLSNPKHVVYVWIDALANYISALGYNSSDDSDYKKYWLGNDAKVYHVIGKDILRFHAIYWPIMLMALGEPINFHLIAHGWILTRDGKMSKSRGNAVYPEDLYSRYGADSVRYYLAKEMPLGNDGLFSYDRFIERFNNDLANDLGNLLSRTVAMVEKYFDGIVPTNYASTPFDLDLEKVAENAIIETTKEFDKFQLQNAINQTWTLIRRANKYIDETAPWALAKDESKKEELKSVLYHLVEVLRVSASLVSPYLVESAPKILEALGLENEKLSYVNLTYGLKYEAKVKKMDPLFKRLDMNAELAHFEALIEERIKALNPAKKEEIKVAKKEEITIDDFAKVQLVVGEILEASLHPNANKLLVFKVKLGDQVRQIVSGIAAHYKPDDLVGKKVVVVANLAPVKLRGVESQGMLLCASTKDTLELLDIKDAPSGAEIK